MRVWAALMACATSARVLHQGLHEAALRLEQSPPSCWPMSCSPLPLSRGLRVYIHPDIVLE